MINSEKAQIITFGRKGLKRYGHKPYPVVFLDRQND